MQISANCVDITITQNLPERFRLAVIVWLNSEGLPARISRPQRGARFLRYYQANARLNTVRTELLFSTPPKKVIILWHHILTTQFVHILNFSSTRIRYFGARSKALKLNCFPQAFLHLPTFFFSLEAYVYSKLRSDIKSCHGWFLFSPIRKQITLAGVSRRYPIEARGIYK
jgi:hypothetical protein